MDFAVSCPLVRYGRLLFGFCLSTRTFVPCFLRTPPRGDSPCIITRPSPPSGRPEDFHLQVTEHAQHTTKPRCGGRCRVPEGRDIGDSRLAVLQNGLSRVTMRRMWTCACWLAPWIRTRRSCCKHSAFQQLPNQSRL